MDTDKSQQIAKVREYIPGRSTPGKLANINIEDVLERIAGGEYASHISNELGVSRPALHYRLRAHPSYQLCREIGTEINLDSGLGNLMTAPDLNSARIADLQLRRLEWRAEREFPSRWGAKQLTHTGVAVTLDASLLGLASALLQQIAAQAPVPIPNISPEPEDVGLDPDDYAAVEVEREIERKEREPE